MPPKLKAHLALLFANIIFGLNYTIAKISLPEYIKPFAYVALRVASGMLIYQFLNRFFIHEKIAYKDFPRLALCALFGIAINQTMFLKGLSITTEINAALIMISTPVMVLVLSHFILGERITYRKFSGIVLGSAGAGFIILFGNDFTPGSSTWLGDLFIFINALSYGLYLILVKPLLKKYHPLSVISWIFIFGFVLVIPNGAHQISEIQWSTFTVSVWWSMVFVLLGPTILAYLLNIWALQKVNPSVVSVYIYSQPLIATLVSSAVGNDHITASKFIAAVFIFAGVYLASQPARKKVNKA